MSLKDEKRTAVSGWQKAAWLPPSLNRSRPDHTCYVEPFCGACWVLLAKDPSRAEVINDADSELATFWRVIQNHLEEFLRYYRYAVSSRELFELEKRKDPSVLTDIQRAARYFYIQKLGFGGRTTGRTFGTSATGPGRLNLLNIEDHLQELYDRLSPPRVTIENLDALGLHPEVRSQNHILLYRSAIL